VHDATASPLAAWESFYVIVGSSAGALIGLQFVVIALMAETQRHSTTREIDAFATPTILHFAATLLVSATVSAPWPSMTGADLALGIYGCIGLVYQAIVIRRTRRQTGYQLVMEDWIWHIALPIVAYAAIVSAAVALGQYTLVSLFVVGGAALLLLFIGIHNAWDTVTYIALDHIQASEAHDPRDA